MSLIQSIYAGFGTALVPPGTGFALHNRGALFTLDETHPNALAPAQAAAAHDHPAFMQKGDMSIGFGIMGGFNQAQAHAQFVANIVDYGLDIQQALEAGRFTKPTFAGADVKSKRSCRRRSGTSWMSSATRSRRFRRGPERSATGRR